MGAENRPLMNTRWYILVWCVCLCMAVSEAAALPVEPAQAVLQLGEAQTPPDFADANTITFSDYWRVERRAEAVSGWYQMSVQLPQLDTTSTSPLGVLIPNSSGLLEVYWDGEYLGGTMAVTGMGVPVVAGPLLLTLPRSLASAGSHNIKMRFTGTQTSIHFVRAPRIDYLANLQPEFAQKKLTLVYLPLVLGGFSVLAALIFLAAFRRDASARGVRFLSAGLVAASWSVLGMFLSFPEPMAGLAERLRPMTFHLAFVFFFFALNDIRGQRSRLSSPVKWVSIALVAAMLLVPDIRVYQIAVLWSLLTYSLGIWLLVRVAQAAAGPPRHWLILMALSLVPVIVLHDITGVVRGGDFWADQVLSLFNPPLYAFALMMVLISRARMHLSTVETLNRELEDRVAAKHAELEDNYERVAQAERREAVLNERERMVREMHDGLGNQLVSTLAMVESRRFAAEELEAALRDSLDDMRMMVHSLDREESDLMQILALVRERVEPRLTRQGLEFRWRVDDVPNSDHLLPETAGHILRIVQEALTNVIKHAGAHTITLASGVEGDRRFVSIADDGCGFGERTNGRGRGLIHMRERAAQIGGELEIVCATGGERDEGDEGDKGGNGTRVVLWLDAA